ncbi:uncharacterized protein LOC134815761 [Bolinopsis microptera]|uniref:uncharacterized protein LOC134815761 n=1 Tax=Bolinopsis microptera TaxID=2820187 RepID=UPI0030794A60
MMELSPLKTAVLFLGLITLLPTARGGVTIKRDTLFANTLEKWNVKIRDRRDLSERYDRFKRAVDSVERTTSGIVLRSLNSFTVMNNEEWETIAVPILRESLNNSTDKLVSVKKRSTERHPEHLPHPKHLPLENNNWEEEVGLVAPADQGSCGACWSFPDIGAMEAVNTKLTGEHKAFSQQYFVDCSYSYSGCAGGTVNYGFKLTQQRQFLPAYEDYPFTGDFNGCPYTDDFKTMKNNAMTKIWIQDYMPLEKNEHGLMEGLLTSPVTMGVTISEDLFAYSGGEFVDENCATAAKPHALLLVGYTEKTLRVKASYGTDFGEGGYINYLRGHPSLHNCHFFEHAYSVLATYRRDLEYKYCNDHKPTTHAICQESCLAMNTETESGWNLAVIPSHYHNQIVVDMLNVDFPGKANELWIGLTGHGDDFSFYDWADNFTPAHFIWMSKDGFGRRYGLIMQTDGKWTTKGSETYETRGLCSRAINCWNIENAVKNGAVKFNKADLSEGTVASVKCTNGLEVEGASKLTCVGGLWDSEIPQCVEPVAAPVAAPVLLKGGRKGKKSKGGRAKKERKPKDKLHRSKGELE